MEKTKDAKKMKREGAPLLTPVSRYPEICKTILLLAMGYCFCFLFLLDYSNPEMNVFHRESTTSFTVYRHPILFYIYVALLTLTIFFNLDLARRRYNNNSRIVAFLQYLGFIVMCIAVCVKTDLEGPRHVIHLGCSIIFGVANIACLETLFFLQTRKDRRFRKFFIGGLIFIAIVLPAFIIRLSGIVETVPLLFSMFILYLVNHTKVIEPAK